MNNQAIVVQINKIDKHPNADKIALAKLLGTQVVVSKEVKIGDKLIYVDSNMKMSDGFLKANNLYRHAEMNADNTKTGFFEDHGRVKCIKMRGEISDGFLFPLEYLNYIHGDLLITDFPVGYEFDKVGNETFCEKYIVPQKTPGEPGSKNRDSVKKLEIPMFKEHFDTGQFMREKNVIPAGTVCYLEEKIHGTSHRSGLMEVDTFESNSWWYKLLYKLANGFNETPLVTGWMYLNGTRRVIHNPNKVHQAYHDNTMREEVLEKVRGQLFKGEQIYLELYGYEKTGSQIQKGFPYGCYADTKFKCTLCEDTHMSVKPFKELVDKGQRCPNCSGEIEEILQYRATMYRATMNNEDGEIVDYPREWVYNRAEELGFEKPHLFEKYYHDGTEASMETLEQKMISYAQGQSEIGKGAENTLKEGVVVWFITSSGRWKALKYKSDAFRLKESGDRDKGIVDQEDTN